MTTIAATKIVSLGRRGRGIGKPLFPAIGALIIIFITISSAFHLRLLTPPRPSALYNYRITSGVETDEAKSVGLALVHCLEDNMSYLDQVPNSWSPFIVYETCGQQSHPTASMPFKNAGSEECTAYLDYIITHYEKLPDISIFLQADALRGYQPTVKSKVANEAGWRGHTPFNNITEMASHTLQMFNTKSQHSSTNRGFLHFGPPRDEWPGGFGTKSVRNYSSFSKDYLGELWDDMGFSFDNSTGNDTQINTRPNACFAVGKERILSIKKETYQTIQKKILLSGNKETPPEAYRRCYCLELSWHVLFGEPPILPITSSMDHVYKRT